MLERGAVKAGESQKAKVTELRSSDSGDSMEAPVVTILKLVTVVSLWRKAPPSHEHKSGAQAIGWMVSF